MTKINCNNGKFNFDYFKEKINTVHEKLELDDFNENYILMAKLNVEIAKKVNEFNEYLMSKDGLVGSAWIIIMMIYSSEEELSAIDLCDSLGQSKATVSRIIESLKDKDLISEVENKKDRRRNNLMITETGISYIKNKIKIHRNYYNLVFGNINVESLVPEMLKVLNNMNKESL